MTAPEEPSTFFDPAAPIDLFGWRKNILRPTLVFNLAKRAKEASDTGEDFVITPDESVALQAAILHWDELGRYWLGGILR